MNAMQSLVARQQLILENQSKKLALRREQLKKAITLLKQLNKTPTSTYVCMHVCFMSVYRMFICKVCIK